jgi:hypothetical protein
MTTAPLTVCLEVGRKKIFASALDWPGWCRSARVSDGDEGALEALAGYAERYAEVAKVAGLKFPSSVGAINGFDVVERLPGDMTTDFGAPNAIARCEREPVTGAAGARLAALVTACWTVLDAVAAASPAELRKGPRGGGRDRDKLVSHVLAAEAAYARKIGVRHRAPAFDDAAAISALRTDLAASLRTPGDAPTAWPQRYAARRLAWHVLDHAWEMQDKS